MRAEVSRREPSTPSRQKRRTVAYLRGLLIVALGALLLQSGSIAAGPEALGLLLILVLSDAAILLTPLRIAGSLRFELVVGALDVGLIAAGLHLAGASSGVLPVSALLVVLVVALANYRGRAVAGIAVVGALHAWLIFAVGDTTTSAGALALQILLLGSIGLYYGYLAEGIHHLHKQNEADHIEYRESRILLEILDTVTSSLDLGHVTRTIVDKISTVIPAVRCSMLFVDERSDRCFVMASHDNPELEMLELDLGKYPEVRQAIETRNAVLIQNVAADPRMAEVRRVLESLDFQSIMVVPLLFGSDVLGTLCMKTARADHPFSRREIDFSTAVARASANALKNALLHREIHEESTRYREVAEKLSRIVDYSPDLILTTDNDGNVTEFNRGAEALLGYAREEILGRSCDTLIDGEPGDLVRRVHAAGVLSNHACRLRKADGARLDVELNMSALKDDTGESTGTVWLGRDVTELKATQLQLLQAKKLSTIGEVISGVAHELNNPLSGVLGFSQLLLARHGDSPLRRELERIHESALRCQRIVKNLLSFARGHKPERRYLGVNGIIEKTLDIKKYQLHVNNIEVVRELDPELPCTMIDFHQLQQVLLNLLNNAQHAMTGEEQPHGRLVVRTSRVGDSLRVEVSDNGIGMSQETLERIFDPFFTTKAPGRGTGLGLSVSYGIVHEHGGKIYARSRVGEGSTFVVELPLRKPESTQEESPACDVAPVSLPESSGSRILVVDDEPLILDLLLEVLDGRGHRVDTASNGSEACRKLSTNHYDLVITDVRMPEMNGIELYRDVLSARPELDGKVVFITGDLIDKEILGFLAEINAPTLPKPLEIDQVIHLVDDLLGCAVPA